MVFTIVTIIFLPMSFIAAFFAINFEDWGGQLTIGYVSKYMFGIGLAISFLFVTSAFLVHEISDAWKTIWKRARAYANVLSQKAKFGSHKDRPLPANIQSWEKEDESSCYKTGAAAAATNAFHRPVGEDVDWKRRSVLDGPDSTYTMRMSRDREHAMLGLSPRFGPRKMSIGSGGIPRLSLDARRGRFSGDLERGRDPSRSRMRWDAAR